MYVRLKMVDVGIIMTRHQKYHLQWMIDHSYSLQDLMRDPTELQYDDSEDNDRISTPVSELFDELEFDCGFGSEIWAARKSGVMQNAHKEKLSIFYGILTQRT